MVQLLKQAPISCAGHTRPVVDICFSGETDCGSLFITASKDGKAILRQGDTGDWIGTFLGHKGAIWSCALNKHATKAATGAADFTAKIWDAISGQELLSISQDHIVRCVDLSRTDLGARLLTANNSRKLSVYNLESAEKPLLAFDGHEGIIRRALWCNADRLAISVSEDKTIRLWDLGMFKQEPVASFQLWVDNFKDPITDFQFCSSLNEEDLEQALAVAASGNVACVYSLDWRYIKSTQPPVPSTSFNLPCPIYSVSLHPTEQLLVCGGEDHLIYRLNSKSGEILETCKGHFGPVHCVRFSPDGNLFSSGSEDGTVRLWQTVVGQEFGLWKLHLPNEESKRKSSEFSPKQDQNNESESTDNTSGIKLDS